MFRVTQIIRNSFLRLEGFLGIIFKTVFSLVGNFLGFFGRIFGFTQPNYFLESEQAQGIKQAAKPEVIQPVQEKVPETPATSPRRRNTKMDDYYLNMARDIQKN